MKKKLYLITAMASFTLCLILILAINIWYFRPLSIDLYYYRVFIQFASFKPEKLTELRLLEQFGITEHNAKLNDYSIAAKRSVYDYLRQQQQVFLTYPRENYSGSDLLSYDVFDYYIKNFLEGEPWVLHEFAVNQFYGIHTDLPNFMVYQHYIDSAHSARQYLVRPE